MKHATEQVANNVWAGVKGVIGGSAGVDYPYWSGGYVQSWIFTEGGPAPNDYTQSLRNQPDYYPLPAQTWQHLYKTYTYVTISNANPFAAHIEYQGSPSHPGVPWHVAFDAYTHATKSLAPFV